MSQMVLLLLSLTVAASLLEMKGVANARIRCASCEGVKCVPPSPGCELGRRPCNCCLECRVQHGGDCGPFTTECESHLVCHTFDGQLHVGRPPVDSGFSGRCLPSPAMPTPRPMRRIMGQTSVLYSNIQTSVLYSNIQTYISPVLKLVRPLPCHGWSLGHTWDRTVWPSPALWTHVGQDGMALPCPGDTRGTGRYGHPLPWGHTWDRTVWPSPALGTHVGQDGMALPCPGDTRGTGRYGHPLPWGHTWDRTVWPSPALGTHVGQDGMAPPFL
ncbi:hypothetical protein ACOMHN_022908 [Nucella lapillus]